MEEACRTCRHWRGGADKRGICRRFPVAERKAWWDICGEWSGKGQPPEGAVESVADAIDILKRSVAKETPPPRLNPARVCSYCKVEYEKGEPGARVSHGMCPACVKLLDALQAAGYGAGQANDILIEIAEGKDSPYGVFGGAPRAQNIPRLLGALVDWHAAHHQDEEEGE
jgi:hypothetical protein